MERFSAPQTLNSNKLRKEETETQRKEEIGLELAAIVEFSEYAFIGLNLDGTIRTWNPAAECLFGYLPAEVLGKHTDILIPRICPTPLRG